MKTALRASIVTLTGDPFLQPLEESYNYIEDGLIVIEDGKIASVSPYSAQTADGLDITHYQNALICPGFIDTHIHYPQTEMIGAYAATLMEWLHNYAFISEQKFSDHKYAEKIAAFFMRELLRNGTTTASVFCTVHPESVDALFEESTRYNTCMLAGKVMMDREAPKLLTDTAMSSYDDSRALLERWHGKGRQLYSITPRFAPTSTPEQLKAAGKLRAEYPQAYLQTHINESQDEIALVKQLFPNNTDYLQVYEDAGLVGAKSLFAHAIQMSESEFQRCADAGAAVSHCPTSNLFIGNGFFRVFDAKKASRPVRTGLATDVGGGTSFSMLQTLNEAYKVAQSNNTRLHPLQGLYLATRGSAEALYMEDSIGSILPGFNADLIVLDLKATDLLALRMDSAKDIIEKLFILMTIADDRAVKATYVAGKRVFFEGSFSYA